MDGLGERFLAINVFAHPHGHDAGEAMAVVGRRNRDGVNGLVHLLEHLPKVPVEFGLREILGLAVQGALVHVTQGYYVAAQFGCALVSLLPLPPTPMQATLILLVRFWPRSRYGPDKAVAPAIKPE